MTAPAIEFLPLVECKSWCEDGDGHPRQCFKSDQACWSPAQYVDLSLEPVIVEGDDRFPHQIGVMARQRPEEAGHVYLHLRDVKLYGPIPSPYDYLDHGLQLTTDEALRLAEALIANVKLVRNQPG